METWVCAGWVLSSNGHMDVCWVGVEQQWRHGCVLASKGHIGMCLFVVDQQWRHGCVFVS